MSSRRQKRSQRGREEKKGPYVFRHPFHNVDHSVLVEAIAKMAEFNQAAFPELVEKLFDAMRRCYPPQILATLAAYGLSVGASDEGVADRPLSSGIEQHHVELLQAFLLTMPIEQWGELPATPNDMQLIIDTLGELGEAFHYKRLLEVKQERDDQQKAILGIQERMRVHTQVVRNWGYFSHVIEISKELYAPLDNGLREFHGFSASDLIEIARAQLSIVEARGNQRFKLLKRIFRERNVRRLVRSFFRDYPGVEGDPEEYIRSLPSHATAEIIAAQLLAHTDRQLPLIYLTSAEELSRATGIQVDVVRKAMDAVALSPGVLADLAPERIFLDNPVWRSPVLKTGDHYFCPLPMEVFSFIHDILGALIETANMKAELNARRAAYLEGKVGQLLGKALPAAAITRNARWRVGNVEYETDLIARLDRTVVIVEAKSAILSAPALRGAPDRVKRHIRDLIVTPSDQSARLAEMIIQATSQNAEAVASLSTISMDFGGVERVVRLSVTLDDFSVLASSEGRLRAAGWVPESLELAPTLGLADFVCLLEILRSPGLFIHYLVERGRFQKAVELVADEMDLLGFYLKTGFNVGGLEETPRTLAMAGMSLDIDRFFNSRDAGIVVAKPSPRLTPYFKSLMEGIQQQAFPGWIDVIVDLLSLAGYEEQREIDRALGSLRRGVEKNWRGDAHQNAIVIVPPPFRNVPVVFYVFPPQLAATRRESVRNLAGQVLEETKKVRCVVIARDTSKWDSAPYAFVYVARGESPGTIEAAPNS